jgi:transcriptional regulator with XRE-family HTH domain
MNDLILTVRARRLLKEVKRLRNEAGLKVLRAAKQLGIGESTLWRMENGHSRLTMEVLVAMLDLYGVPTPEREAMERLGIDSVRRGWWAPYADVFSGSYVALETDASQIRVNAFVIPGFFQTEEYARAAIANTGLELEAAEVERRKAARLARQQALFEDRDKPPAIHLLLDESVVHRQVGGPAAMRGQLERIAEVAARQTVTIQITPFTAGIHAGIDGEFVIIDFPDPQDDPFVYEEGLGGDLYLEDSKSLARYSLAFDRVKDVALTPERSVDLINRLAKEQE